jgi:hypothetical protein
VLEGYLTVMEGNVPLLPAQVVLDTVPFQPLELSVPVELGTVLDVSEWPHSSRISFTFSA